MDFLSRSAVALMMAFVAYQASAAFNTVGRPVVVDDAYVVSSGSALVVGVPGVLANDSDPDGDPLTTVLVSGPTHGTLTFGRDGSFTYQAAPGFVGEDTFVYVANDGHTVSLRATARINVVGTNTQPAVNIVSPNDGAVLLGQTTFSIVADATDAGANIESVRFFLNGIAVANLTQGPFYFVVSNCVPGSYQMLAVVTSSSGLSATSAPVTVEVITNALVAVSPLVMNYETGLFEQFVEVSNRTSQAWSSGVRLSVHDLTVPCEVSNATGTCDGVPFFENYNPLAPGGTITFALQYYVPEQGSAPAPTLVALPLQGGPASNTPNITSITALNGDVVEVKFVSCPGRVYYLQCSEDFVHWKTELAPIVSIGSSTATLQNRAGGKCFYRIMGVP